MIIKIVHYDTIGKRGICVPGGEAAPKQVILIDGVDEVEHEKVACHNHKELAILADQFGYALDGRWYGERLPESNEGEDQGGGREALLMRIKRKGVESSIVAISPMVFFMNESGKTVDRVNCR